MIVPLLYIIVNVIFQKKNIATLTISNIRCYNVDMTTKQALYKYLDTLEECNLYGLELQRLINGITGKSTYASTILSYMREYVDIAGAELKCVSNKKSEYHYVPGIKISGAIGYNIE
jgi:hypothetical protein